MSTDTHAQRQQQHLFPQQLQQQQLQQQQHQFRSNANTLAHKFTANDACHMTPSCLPAFLPSYPSDMDIYIYCMWSGGCLNSVKCEIYVGK